ncbi:DinQ-like type I toxin DqlB [Salmonella enterica]|nr:DinQ-like type I toxin DqlB [Salmonella enterica]
MINLLIIVLRAVVAVANALIAILGDAANLLI